MAEFHALKVSEVRPLTEEATSVAFSVPDELSDAYRFAHGQYLTLKAEVGGEELRRSYSICSAVGEGELRVAVKRVPEGRFSNHVNDNLKAGDVVEVMTPMGNFTAPIEPKAARHYVGFAGGSGITPFMSIIKTVLSQEPDSTFTLFYGNRSVAGIMFKEELEEIKDRYLERFRLFHILSDEPQEIELFHGLLDRDKTRALTQGLIDIERIDLFFICGPGPMMDAVREVLGELGVPEARQKLELFGTPPPQAGPVVRKRADGASAAVTVIHHGVRSTFEVPREGPSIIDAAYARDLDLPFSCKGGVCCTCKARLLEGEVEMDVCYGLEPEEVEAGYVLTCQSHPRSEKIVLDYDH